ncbi:MAG: anti-sigma regulatory factor [Gemmatimonadetes bacterium]|nr:anti-sigma regulatory factor [Gemmatimonadota bacterium]
MLIRRESDILAARERGRALAAEAGFALGDQVVIASAISEVGRNIMQYAGEGVIELALHRRGDAAGIVIVAWDRGPGIPDIPLALQDGYSTDGDRYGLGLPGVRRVMDDFAIQSTLGNGTRVTMTKWSAPRWYSAPTVPIQKGGHPSAPQAARSLVSRRAAR